MATKGTCGAIRANGAFVSQKRFLSTRMSLTGTSKRSVIHQSLYGSERTEEPREIICAKRAPLACKSIEAFGLELLCRRSSGVQLVLTNDDVGIQSGARIQVFWTIAAG